MRFRKRNWLWETKTQELERRIAALEASVQESHERINQIRQEMSKRDH